MDGDREEIHDEAAVQEFIDSCLDVTSTSAMIGLGGKKAGVFPPFLLIARVPGFHHEGLPGTTSGGARASACDWRWGVIGGPTPYACLELFWPNGEERRIKVNLRSSVRSLFVDLEAAASPVGIVELGIAEEGNLLEGALTTIQLDTHDEMFRALASHVREQDDSG